MCYAPLVMLRGRRSRAISECPGASSRVENPLSPIIPLLTRHSPVSPIIPVHTQKQGGGRSIFMVTYLKYVGAPTFPSWRDTGMLHVQHPGRTRGLFVVGDADEARQSHAGAERRVHGRIADLDGVSAAIGLPVLGGDIVEGEGAGIERDGDALRFASRKLHAREALQLLSGTRHFRAGLPNVELRNIGTGTGTRVGDVEGNGIERGTSAGRQCRRACRSNRQIAEFECSVGEAEAERELRLHIIVFVAAITDKNSFLVGHANSVCFRIVVRVRRIVLPALFKRIGKMPG